MGIGDDLHEKLLSIGLVEPRGNLSGMRIGEFVESFIAARLDVKPGTVMNYRACQTKLLAYFDADTLLARMTTLDADRFRSWLKGDKQTKRGMGLNENSVRSIVKNTKLIFGAAVKGRLLIERTRSKPQDRRLRQQKPMTVAASEKCRSFLKSAGRWKNSFLNPMAGSLSFRWRTGIAPQI